ncbi:MAG TPA: hypothetical protein VFT50_07055 [Baekduia sp.]|nr:hypothetical protein [Baekduia sp.]
MLASALSATGLVIAGIVFVVLFVILGVTLWVSLVAAGGALLLWAVMGGGAQAARHRGQGHPSHS